MQRIGLVGCGFIGRIHSWGLWALREAGLSDARIVAVCDSDAERAASLAAPNDANVATLPVLLDEVDVVYVCTPTAGHLPVVEAVVERGRAVFCEKPLAGDLAEAQRVAGLLERVPHQVGLVLRCAPVFVTMADFVASGRYGRPMVASLRDDQYFPIGGQYASGWRALVDVAGGGTLIEHSIHDVDLFRWVVGEPTEVTCRTSSFFEHPGIEDVAVATITCEGGATANLVSVWHQVTSRPSTRRLEVFCQEAFLWTENDNWGPLHVQTATSDEVVECPSPPWVDKLRVPVEVRRALGLYAEASRRFLASIETGSAGSPGGGDALAAHRVVDAAYRSAADGGRPVTI